MNENEIDKLRFIAKDEALLTALHKLFYVRIEEEKPKVSDENNALLGEKYRGYEKSKEVIEKIFIELRGYEQPEDKPGDESRAI